MQCYVKLFNYKEVKDTSLLTIDEANDDDRERRSRRHTRLLELSSSSLEVDVVDGLDYHPEGGPSTSTGHPRHRQAQGPSDRIGGLSPTQLREHYGSCIKLAAENKINAKNAFGLHLIDYLSDLLVRNELESFQMASSSLDASAKIYAGRVDAIHLDTYKVLTGLGRTTSINPDLDDEGVENHRQEDRGKRKLDESEDEESGLDEGTQGTQTNKDIRNGKHKRKVCCLAKNLTKIRMRSSALKAEVDPHFQHEAISYDEGGTTAVRLNRVSTLTDACELVLDSNTPMLINHSSRSSSPQQRRATAGLISLEGNWRTLFCDIRRGHLQRHEIGTSLKEPLDDIRIISPHFRDFQFMEHENSDSEDTDWDIFDKLPRQVSPCKISLTNPTSIPLDFDEDNDDDFNDIPLDSASSKSTDLFKESTDISKEAIDTNLSHSVQNGYLEKDIESPHSIEDHTQVGEVFVDGLRKLISEQINDCGELKENHVGIWSGPEACKTPTALNAEHAVTPVKIPVPKKIMTPKVVPTLFTNILEGSKTNGFQRIEKVNYDDLFADTKKSTVLSHDTINQSSRDFNLLPRIDDSKTFIQLCKNAKMLLTRPAESPFYNERSESGLSSDPSEAPPFSPPSIHDDAPPCPLLPNIDLDSQEDDDVLSPLAPSPLTAEGEDSNDVFPTLLSRQNSQTATQQTIDLLSQPRNMANRLEITYAKIAKQINVRRVKEVLWTLIVNPSPHIGLTTSFNSDSSSSLSPTKPLPQEPSSSLSTVDVCGPGVLNSSQLSELIEAVPSSGLGPKVINELSVPIILTCLLHLANEKDLFLENSDDFGDLTISHGLPEREWNSLRKYSQRFSIPNPRKRKARDSS